MPAESTVWRPDVGTQETAPGPPASGATYQRGDPIEVRVDFDDPVAVTGTPQVSVSIGSQTRAAALSSVAGTRSRAFSLFFGYTVQSADNDTDGISIGAGR